MYKMKEIQEWLGHSNFSTTADVYSHLDFSSKINAAQTISSVYDDGNMPIETTIPPSKEQDLMEIFANALQEMQELGIANLEEYLAYKKEEALTEIRKKAYGYVK